ncbi:MAG: NAD(P)/FAD-dependent oxidoreductase [Solirubrobacteraceae bacterium]
MPAAAPAHRVVVVGGGFGGLRVVKALRDAPVDVTLVDCRNFHLFQPLTYQVATGTLSPSDVTYPLRVLFGPAANVSVLLAAVTGFDLDRRQVMLAGDREHGAPESLQYDTLVVATGSSYTYFGHDDWREVAGEVKSLESAIAVRSRVLGAFERAEATSNQTERDAELTFVVVGGGPTGVEIAGQIGELARDSLEHDFKHVKPGATRIMLVETAERILSSFPASLSDKAMAALRKLGVTPTVGRTVVNIEPAGVTLRAPDGSTERVSARTVIWAAGVRASALAGQLGEQSGAEIDQAGRVTVEPDLTLPGLAPVAIQQGAYAARLIKRRLRNQPARPFRYVNKGNLATIGRGRAVADLGVVRLSGLPAWLIWLGVHIWYLIGYQNRLVVMLRWSISFLTRGRAQGSRIISDPEVEREQR